MAGSELSETVIKAIKSVDKLVSNIRKDTAKVIAALKK